VAGARGGAYTVRWSRYLDSPTVRPWRRRWREARQRSGFVFARRFVLGFALIQFAIAFFALDEGLAQTATAAAVAGTSPLLGLEAARGGATVTFDGAFSYSVQPGCTGVTVAGMLLAAVLAYPAGLRRRLAVAVNLLRLDTMGWLGVHLPGAFRVMHELGWEAGVILVGALGFALWVRVAEALDREGPAVVRVRATLVSAAVFLVLFAGGMVVAVWLQADLALGRALVVLSTPLGSALWGDAYPPRHLAVFIKPMLFLTAFVGYAALFLATPGVPLRRRAWAALWGGVAPGVLGGVLGTLVVGAARLGEVGNHPLSVSVLLLGHLGVPLLAWALWSARLRREREAGAEAGRAAVPRGALEGAAGTGASKGRAPTRRG
jgi:hypothetical protein